MLLFFLMFNEDKLLQLRNFDLYVEFLNGKVPSLSRAKFISCCKSN
ncbi:hypothetical protein J2S21_000034 [Peribacillus cavernae]|nr:hypothetical protein [Peribacillus cavernae]